MGWGSWEDTQVVSHHYNGCGLIAEIIKLK